MFHRGMASACLIIYGTATLFAFTNPGDPPVMRAPVSARATSLGNALYCDGEEGIHYNPAYLGVTGTAVVRGTYGIFYENTRFAHASYYMPSGHGGFAGAYTGIFSRFDNFVDADSPARGTVDISQSLVSAGAGMRVNDSPLLLGAGVRALVDRIAGAPSTSWIIDAGMGYIFSSRLKAGLVARNALWLTSENKDDAAGVAGVLSAAWQVPWTFGGQISRDTNTLFAAARREDDGRVYAGFGWESVFSRILALRVGWDRDSPSAGFGFQYGSVVFDIATSWRKETFLNFVTLGFHFSRPPLPVQAVAVKKAAVKPADGPPEKKQPSSVAVTPGDPAEEGWQRLQNDDTAGAETIFTRVLKKEPGHFSATQGMQEVRVRQERERKKNMIGSSLSQGKAALERKDFAKAADLFAAALVESPKNETAEEGIRASVEGAARVLSAAIEKKLGSPAIKPTVTRPESSAMARSKSFESFASAGTYLLNDSVGNALAAWQKVALKDNPLAQRFDRSFSTLVTNECAAAIARAARDAEKGLYAQAIAELDAVIALPGLSGGEKYRAQGMVSSYRYVGTAMGKASFDQGLRAMGQGQHAQAVTLFERAVQCGYQTDEARRHIADLKARPATLQREEFSPGDVKENLARARELFRLNELAQARVYLIRVLYVEPRNAEARKMMDEIENN